MQYIVSTEKVIRYVAKFATKSKPSSKGLQELIQYIYEKYQREWHNAHSNAKLLTITIGVRYFSAQETCHMGVDKYCGKGGGLKRIHTFPPAHSIKTIFFKYHSTGTCFIIVKA